MPSDIEQIAEDAFMRATSKGSASINAVHASARAVLKEMTMRKYIVTLREGSMCLAAGLAVEFLGAEAHVTCKNGAERETFWAQRLAFLRANPNA